MKSHKIYVLSTLFLVFGLSLSVQNEVLAGSQAPVFDGKYKSLHCMELPFMFNNINLANHMTGGGEAAHVRSLSVP